MPISNQPTVHCGEPFANLGHGEPPVRRDWTLAGTCRWGLRSQRSPYERSFDSGNESGRKRIAHPFTVRRDDGMPENRRDEPWPVMVAVEAAAPWTAERAMMLEVEDAGVLRLRAMGGSRERSLFSKVSAAGITACVEGVHSRGRAKWHPSTRHPTLWQARASCDHQRGRGDRYLGLSFKSRNRCPI